MICDCICYCQNCAYGGLTGPLLQRRITPGAPMQPPVVHQACSTVSGQTALHDSPSKQGTSPTTSHTQRAPIPTHGSLSLSSYCLRRARASAISFSSSSLKPPAVPSLRVSTVPGLGVLHMLHCARRAQFMLPQPGHIQSSGANMPAGPCGAADTRPRPLPLGGPAAAPGAAAAAAAGGAP